MRAATLLVCIGGVALLASCDAAPLPTEPAAKMTRHSGAFANDLGPASNEKFGVLAPEMMTMSNSEKRRMAGLIRQSGAKMVRITWYWPAFQPSGTWGNPNWDQPMLNWGAELLQVLADSGLQLYVTLERTPAWARGCSDYYQDTVLCDYRRPPGQGYWLPWYWFVYDMVQRFPQVAVWGIWNEPDDTTRGYLRPIPPDTTWQIAYWHLFVNGANAVHDAGGRVAGPELGGGSSPEGWNGLQSFEWFLANLGWVLNANDVVTVHHYNTAASLASWVQALRDRMNWAGLGNRELWVTEGGPAQPYQVADQEAQAILVTQRYGVITSGSIPGFTKLFWMPFLAPMTNPSVEPIIYGNLNPAVPRLAYDCWTAMARGLTIPSFCYNGLSVHIDNVGGCSFSATTNMPEPTSYTWYLDGGWYGTGESIDIPPGSYWLQVVVANNRGNSKSGYTFASCGYS